MGMGWTQSGHTGQAGDLCPGRAGEDGAGLHRATQNGTKFIAYQ